MSWRYFQLGWRGGPSGICSRFTCVRSQWQPDGSYFISNSASWWTIYGWLAPEHAIKTFWIGFLSTGVATILYCLFMPSLSGTRFRRCCLSAAFVPFLLPGTHERFFILADVLAFLYALARPTPRTIAAAILMQIASALPVYVWAFQAEPLQLLAPAFAIVAIYLILRELTAPADAVGIIDEPVAKSALSHARRSQGA